MKSPRVASYRLLFDKSLRLVTINDFDFQDHERLYKLGVVQATHEGNFVLEMWSLQSVNTVARSIIWRWKKASLPVPVLRIQMFDSAGRFLSSQIIE